MGHFLEKHNEHQNLGLTSIFNKISHLLGSFQPFLPKTSWHEYNLELECGVCRLVSWVAKTFLAPQLDQQVAHLPPSGKYNELQN